MLSTLQRLANRAHVGDSDGFTLIELLIVVVIIGILAAIAIPQFSSTKESAYDASAKSDLRNVMTAEEGFFARAGTYTGFTANNAGTTIELSDGTNTVTANLSEGVVAQGTGASNGFTATAKHQDSGNTFCINTTSSATDPGEIVQGSSC